MENTEAIVHLLTEIRDHLREDGAWRKKAIEEQGRVQRVAARRQLMGLVVGGGAILVMVVLFLFGWSTGFFHAKPSAPQRELYKP